MTPAILSLLSRLSYIEQVCGTLTDRTQIDAAALSALDQCEVWPGDAALFKRIVKAGIIKSARFRSPQGYKVHGFLIHLCDLQAERRMTYEEFDIHCESELEEMTALLGTMPQEAQGEIIIWTEKMDTHKQFSFNDTCKIVFNTWIDDCKVGDTVTDSKTRQQVEIVAIDRTVSPSEAVTVKVGEQTYVLHPMNITI